MAECVDEDDGDEDARDEQLPPLPPGGSGHCGRSLLDSCVDQNVEDNEGEKWRDLEYNT